MMNENTSTKAGFVALLGAPNAGKSTLVNTLVGAKVSIISPKVQTTRMRVRGICMADEATQIILIDTPGIFAAKHRLEKAMVSAAWEGMREADAVCLLIDSRKGLCANTRMIIEEMQKSNQSAFLLLNKVDTVRKDKLLELVTQAHALMPFEETFMVSAKTGDGVEDLKQRLAARMPESVWFYPPDQVADMHMRLLASEITREKLFLHLQQELPYAITVETEQWLERDKGDVRIDQIIYVERESQKGIVLGKGGEKLKTIGASSRRELSEMLEQKVHLFLHVKVRENWKNNPAMYHYLGLEF